MFEYDAFPPVPENEWQGSELRHAVLLAQQIAGHLRHDERFRPEEAVQEDFGAVLPVRGPYGETTITISMHPRGNSDFTWAVQFSQRLPLVRALFSKGDDPSVVDPVADAVSALVLSQPERYRDPEWLED